MSEELCNQDTIRQETGDWALHFSSLVYPYTCLLTLMIDKSSKLSHTVSRKILKYLTSLTGLAAVWPGMVSCVVVRWWWGGGVMVWWLQVIFLNWSGLPASRERERTQYLQHHHQYQALQVTQPATPLCNTQPRWNPPPPTSTSTSSQCYTAPPGINNV